MPSAPGLLTEYGEVMSKGWAKLDQEIPAALGRIAGCLPSALIDTLREQWNGPAGLDEQVAEIERRMRDWKKEGKVVKAICQIPGVGSLTTTAAVAVMGTQKRSVRGGNLRRGRASCPSRLVRAARWSCMESVSEAARTAHATH